MTSYGGNLNYVMKNVLNSPEARYRNTAADVQLISVSTQEFTKYGTETRRKVILIVQLMFYRKTD